MTVFIFTLISFLFLLVFLFTTLRFVIGSLLIKAILTYLHHHHQFNVHVLPRLIKGVDGCFPTV